MQIEKLQVEKSFQFDAEKVGGVTYDGASVWVSTVAEGAWTLARVDRATGGVQRRVSIPGKVSGMTWDGDNLWGVRDDGIACYDPETLEVRRLLPLPPAEGFISGLAWDGEALWVGAYHQRKIFKLDPETGRVLHVVATDRFVTGVAWAEGELWHAVDSCDETQLPTEVRRLEKDSGQILDRIAVPYPVSGIGHDGDAFWFGDCVNGVLRCVKADA